MTYTSHSGPADDSTSGWWVLTFVSSSRAFMTVRFYACPVHNNSLEASDCIPGATRAGPHSERQHSNSAKWCQRPACERHLRCGRFLSEGTRGAVSERCVKGVMWVFWWGRGPESLKSGHGCALKTHRPRRYISRGLPVSAYAARIRLRNFSLCSSFTLPNAMASITMSESPTRKRIFCMPRM